MRTSASQGVGHRGRDRVRRARLIALSATVLSLIATAVQPSAAGAIVAGVRVPAGSAGFVVNLQRGCSGALIAPDRVLTAAHCAHFGLAHEGQRITLAGGRRSARVVRVAEHGTFVSLMAASRLGLPLAYDVAILKLRSPVRAVAPVAIADATDLPAAAAGVRATAFGYGGIDREGTGAGVLREARLAVRADADCASRLGTHLARLFVPAAMLCTVDPDAAPPYRSGCFGDSGGPLVTTAPGSGVREIAVDAWGPHCGFDRGDPEIYTDLRAVRSFVLAPDPVWRPLAHGRPRLIGAPSPGHVLRCVAPPYLRPAPARRRYVLYAAGRPAGPPQVSPAFHVGRRLRGVLVRCRVVASNRSGTSKSPYSIARRVR
jgi:hypothetical protein